MNYKKLIIRIVLVSIVLLLGYFTWDRVSKSLDTLNSRLRSSEDSLVHFKNRFGEQVSLNKEIFVSLQDYKANRNKEIDSIIGRLKDAGGTIKDLREDLRLGITHDTVEKKVPVYINNSTGVSSFHFTDSCIDIKADIKDSADVKYILQPMELMLLSFEKDGNMYMQGIVKSKCGKITKQEKINIVTKKEKRLSFGFSAGFGLVKPTNSSLGFGFHLGTGLNYKIR